MSLVINSQTNYGPKIVTNGLVLCLDASNSKSYSGSGTTWNDLSGNGNNGTLINGVGYNSSNKGSLVFDGSNDYVSTPLISTNSFTWNVWYKTDVISSGFRNIISIRVPNYMLMLLNSSVNMGFWTSDGLSDVSLNMGPISIDTWYSATLVREGNSITNGYKAYMNGSFRGSANTGIWSSSDPIILGGRTDVNQYLNGNIAQVCIYNRSLSANEVGQNYNATKGRYLL
jgi:hypothetical protein